MKKGFTLIELLAVIIILAIVALVATPIILNVIDDARKSAGRSEASMIYSAINNYCATSAMEQELNGKVDICADGITIEEVSEMASLGNATINEIEYTNGEITKLDITSNQNDYVLCETGTIELKELGCNQPSSGKTITFSWDNCGHGNLTFTVEEGTTWREFVNSDLNTIDPDYDPNYDEPEDSKLFTIYFEGEGNYYGVGCCTGGSAVGFDRSTAILPDDEIIGGHLYESMP